MATYYIPNTSVQAVVIDPNPLDSYVSLFLEHGETGNGKNSGSVNAGTSNDGSVFAVGLGGINGAFANSLKKAGQDTDAYQQIHQNLYKAAGDKLSAFNSKFGSDDPVQFSLIQKPDPGFKLPNYDGIVFIDIFNSGQLPANNNLNYSMVYVVPPNRSNYTDDKTFFNAIEATCITIVEALSLYNTKHAIPGNALALKAIENIRMCLFSGSIYRGTAPQSGVADHNLKGLEHGFTSPHGKKSSIALVNFENSYDSQTRQNVFESIKSKLSTKK